MGYIACKKIKLMKQSANELERLSKQAQPKNFSEFTSWKVKLADIICVGPFHKALMQLYQYESSLAKKVEEKAQRLWQQTNTVTPDSDYNCLGPVDMLRVSVHDLAGILRDIAQIVRKERKRRIVKLIFCVTSAVVIFFAALLTIFHLLGWLEPIRAFIYNIL